MGILDKVFGTSSTEVEIGPAEWVNTSAAVSAHQAMQDGFGASGDEPRSNFLGRPDFGTEGVINIEQSIQISESYRQVLLADQMRDIRKESTANHVVDPGIKDGSQVVITIVPESDEQSGSWDDHMRAKTSGRGLMFPHFSVQSISEPNEQRYQIHETFGADFIQSFGTRPRIFMISGFVINGKVRVGSGPSRRSMDWKNAFQRMFKEHLSLKRCIKENKKIRIFAQHTVWDGYLVNLISQTSAQSQSVAQVTITFILSDESYTKQNDENIPGFVQEGTGFITPGKNSPSDIFPDATLQDYLGEDFGTIINEKISNKAEQREEIVDIINDGAVHVNLLELDPFENSFFNPVPGVRMHEAMRGTQIEKNIVSAFEEREKLNDAIDHLNSISGIVTDKTELIDSDAIDDSDSFQELLEKLADNRAKMRGRKKHVEEMNDLCIQYVNIENERLQLEEMR